MAARLCRTLLSTQQVVDLLDDGEDVDLEKDFCFFPDSYELGFEEVELEDDTVYGNSIIRLGRSDRWACPGCSGDL